MDIPYYVESNWKQINPICSEYWGLDKTQTYIYSSSSRFWAKYKRLNYTTSTSIIDSRDLVEVSWNLICYVRFCCQNNVLKKQSELLTLRTIYSCNTQSLDFYYQALSKVGIHLTEQSNQHRICHLVPDCPVCHRTVRWTSGATAPCAPTVTCRGEQCMSEVRAQKSEGTGLSM
jgi:hypothetical protein